MLAKDFYFFGDLGAHYIGGTTEQSGALLTKTTRKITGGRIALTPGLSYRVLKNLHLEVVIPNIFSVELIKLKNTEDPAFEQTNFSAGTSLNSNSIDFLGVGFKFIF